MAFVLGTAPLYCATLLRHFTAALDRGARLLRGRHKCPPSFLTQSDLRNVYFHYFYTSFARHAYMDAVEGGHVVVTLGHGQVVKKADM